jgi:hypothetical protein
MMGDIYKNANLVVVWLGPAENNSDYAMRIINDLGRKATPNWITETMAPSEEGQLEPHWTDRLQILSFKKQEMNAITLLFSRTYFTRLWVRQEITLASGAIVVCGFEVIDWEKFRSAVFCLYKKVYLRSEVDEVAYLRSRDIVFNLCRMAYFRLRYSYLRYWLRELEWDEPRDAIYGVSELIGNSDQALEIVPDYTQPVSVAFKNVCLQLLNKLNTLDWLGSCEISSRLVPELASWVPDWSVSAKVVAAVPLYLWMDFCRRRVFRTQYSPCAWCSSFSNRVR